MYIMLKIVYDDLTPDIIRDMSDMDLQSLIEFILRKSVDYVVVNDLIRDRNDFKNCYNQLYSQLLANGVNPVVDYYQMGKVGRPKKNTDN